MSQPAGRQRFIDTVARLAAEVYDFHERWGLRDADPAGVMRRRMALLDEEVDELRLEVERADGELSAPDMCEEAADVLFVAIGNMDQLGAPGLAGMEAVTDKNAAKTEHTHFSDPATGKVTRREVGERA